ncbi:MAG TPA: hypothetical protein VGF40_08490, partial [Thermoanaerobaculia bacterium]
EDVMSCVDVNPLEIQLAREVVAPIAGGAGADCVAEDDGTIRVRLRGGPGWKLSAIVFSREGLRRLQTDPDRDVKIEYLQRDIVRAARSRSEYRYPHRIRAL